MSKNYDPSGEPIAAAAQQLLVAARALGASRAASHLRVCCVPYLFEGMERAFGSSEDPVPKIIGLLDSLRGFLDSAAGAGYNLIGAYSAEDPAGRITGIPTIENVTGEHYGRLFREFSKTSFWDEPANLLRDRLERNNIEIPDLSESKVLDAGCGGGRYTVAWKLLGARSAVGIDLSSIGIANAQQRVLEAGFDGVEFQEGSVLDLPFPDNSFDVAFSNGVLHHTLDWKKGIQELVRVLKPGGLGWIYLIENPGGLFWAVIDVLRELMKNENHEFARVSLQLLGIPDNRIFYMLDHVLVPINLRLTPAEIESQLAGAGAVQIRRLTRGADFDRVEQISRDLPFARVKYGVGENRYVFTKISVSSFDSIQEKKFSHE